MRYRLVVAMLVVSGVLRAAAPPNGKPTEGPKLARVVVTGTDKGGVRSSVSFGGGGKFVSVDVSARILKLDEKTTLLVVINHDRVKGMKSEMRGDKVYALSGRLAVEGPGVQTGAIRIRTNGMLTVKGDKALVLLVDAISPIDEKNKNLFPARGKVFVEGAVVCGKRDLKLTSDQTLAVRNGLASVVLNGEKAHTDATGKGTIRATGTLTVDDKGLIRLQAEQLVTGLKSSMAIVAEAAIEEVGGWVRRGEASGGPVLSVSLAQSAVADAHLAYLRAFPALKELDLSGAKVTDDGMKFLRGLKNLHTLSLGQTGVTDKGLAHLKGLSRIKTLSLSGNPVTDAGLSHLKGLAELEMLDLSKTRVTYKGLEHLKGLASLKAVTLDDSQVTDDMLGALVRADKLHTLTQARGPKGRATGMATITSLSLNNTPLTDAGLAHLKGLVDLQSLYLSGTKVTDGGLTHLKGLTKLRSVYASRTKVTPSGAVELQKAIPRVKISR